MRAILNNSRAFIGFCLALSLDLGSNALIICYSFQRTMFFPGLNSPTTTIKDEQWTAESSEQQHDQDVVMPGFRFHPTEEELVEFYLRRKVEGKHFNIDLITFVDLYRYDPWELPALAAIGEKEWFFYVPRDRKYRNGDRPNRVTTSGYWKATGADRTIRNENLRCIGLKKTLVFYTGKAPKGTRTNWIMNEYRLPQFHETDSVGRNQKNELSLCRVYRKAGSDQDPRLQCKKSHKMINVAENENHQSSFVELNNYLTASHHTIPNSRAAGNANRTDLNSKNMAVDLGNLEVSSMEVKSNLSTDGRLHHSIDYGGERIYSEPSNVTGENLWNVSTPRSLNEEVELSLSSCLCSRALDQMHMVEDLCNQSHLVVTNNSMYGFPTGCSDKLWEWNPVRNN